MKTTKVDSMRAVLGFGAAAKAAARKLAAKTQMPVLCRPSRGTVREIQPDGRWSEVEFDGDQILDDMGNPIDAAGKNLIFHFAAIEAVRDFSIL